jgi:hypothetical protein
MTNQNMQPQQPNKQQAPQKGDLQVGKKPAVEEREQRTSTSRANPQPSSPEHTPGQTNQPKNARQFQNEDAELEADQDQKQDDQSKDQRQSDSTQPHHT